MECRKCVSAEKSKHKLNGFYKQLSIEFKIVRRELVPCRKKCVEKFWKESFVAFSYFSVGKEAKNKFHVSHVLEELLSDLGVFFVML